MEDLKRQIDILTKKTEDLEDLIQSHTHDGVRSQQVQVDDLAGLVSTVTSSAELTNRTAGAPLNFNMQMFIYSNGGTNKLYIFDASGNTWYSVTIA